MSKFNHPDLIDLRIQSLIDKINYFQSYLGFTFHQKQVLAIRKELSTARYEKAKLLSEAHKIIFDDFQCNGFKLTHYATKYNLCFDVVSKIISKGLREQVRIAEQKRNDELRNDISEVQE